MKNSIKILLSVIVLSMLFAVGCKKDEPPVTINTVDPIVTTTNYIKFGASSYAISKGLFGRFIGIGDIYDHMCQKLVLMSEGITIYSADGTTLDSIIGHGNILVFTVISSDSTKLTAGLYRYDKYRDGIANSFLTRSWTVLNSNIIGSERSISGGSFKVISDTNNNYVINFNLISSIDSITANYTGPIRSYKYKTTNIF